MERTTELSNEHRDTIVAVEAVLVYLGRFRQDAQKPTLKLYKAYNSLGLLSSSKSALIKTEPDYAGIFQSVETEWRSILLTKFKEALRHTSQNTIPPLSSFFQELAESFVDDLLSHSGLRQLAVSSDEQNQEIYSRLKVTFLKILNDALCDLFIGLKESEMVTSPPENVDLLKKLAAMTKTVFLQDVIYGYPNTRESVQYQKLENGQQQLAVFQLQELVEFVYSLSAVTPDINQLEKIFKLIHKDFLPENKYLEAGNHGFNIFKLVSIFTDSQLKDVNNLSQPPVKELNDIELNIIVKLTILKEIAEAKEKLDFSHIAKKIQKIVPGINPSLLTALIRQNYFLCIKKTAKLETSDNSDSKIPIIEAHINPGDVNHRIVEQVNGVTLPEIVSQVYIPSGRINLPFNNGFFADDWYLKYLRNIGLVDRINETIQQGQIPQDVEEIQVTILGFDGSIYLTGAPPADSGVSKNLTCKSYPLVLSDGRTITVKPNIVILDHHPAEFDKKLSMQSASQQVFDWLQKYSNPEDLKPEDCDMLISIAEGPRAIDTDLVLSDIIIRLKFAEFSWFEKNKNIIKVIVELINKIDIYNGAPILDIPNTAIENYITRVLIWPNLILPKTSVLNIHRSSAANLRVQDITNYDILPFKACVNFLATNFPNISNIEDLIHCFYGSGNEDIIKNLFAYGIALQNEGVPDQECIKITNQFTESYNSNAKLETMNAATLTIKTEKKVRITFLKSEENFATRAQLRSICEIFFLRKSEPEITILEKQNYTCGQLTPPLTSETRDKITEINLVKKLLSDYLDLCYCFLKRLNANPGFIKGGEAAGTRDSGTGTSEFLDNEILIQMFSTHLNKLLETLPLEKITATSIFSNLFVDTSGIVNVSTLEKFNTIIQHNQTNLAANATK